MTDESKPPSQTQLFLHAEFGIPCPSHAIDDERNISDGSSSSPECITTVKQHFDSTNCRPALIGLRGEPVKPQPGDYTYTGMHDHGPLPKPKEGGIFAELIGLCLAAKKSSDQYLTEIIAKEKK